MSQETDPSMTFRRPKGIGVFFCGLFVLVVDAVTIGVMLGMNYRPSDKLAVLIWGIGAIGVLMILIGFVLEFINLLRTGYVKGVLIQLGVLAGIAGVCYLGWSLWAGAPVPGDELAALLGKKRDDPVVTSTMRRLGWHGSGRATPHWDHGVEFNFNKDDELSEIIFHLEYRTYPAGLPLGISREDSKETLKEKLGIPDKEENGVLYFAAKNIEAIFHGNQLTYVRVTR